MADISQWQIPPKLPRPLVLTFLGRLRHFAEAVEFIGITFPSLHCWHNPAGFIILWPWAHTGSICGQAWSIVFIQKMMDCQVRIRGKLLLPVEEYGCFSFRAEGKVFGDKERPNWVSTMTKLHQSMNKRTKFSIFWSSYVPTYTSDGVCCKN